MQPNVLYPDCPLVHQWRRDRAVRQRIPLRESVRQFLGLAALTNASVAEHGHRRFICNDDVEWAAIRDVPVGYFPVSPSMNTREVNLLSMSKAVLRYGRPAIHFDEPQGFHRDFRFMPLPERPTGSAGWRRLYLPQPDGDILEADTHRRLFAVANLLSSAMTRAAFTGMNASGYPLLPEWFQRRPRPKGWAATRVPAPEVWLPRPWIGISVERVPRLLHAEWDATLRMMFTSDLRSGLALQAPARAVYAGVASARCSHRSTVAHALKLEDGQWLGFAVGDHAQVHCRVGDVLEAGQVWCTVLPHLRSEHQPRAAREDAYKVLLRDEAMRLLWLSSQGIRLERYPDRVFYPGSLIAGVVDGSDPRELLWDFAPAHRYHNQEWSAYVMPPIFLRSWDRLRLALPGEVDLDANIGDPRFSRVPSNLDPRQRVNQPLDMHGRFARRPAGTHATRVA